MVGPSMASGGMMMLTRLPSLRRASTSGVDSSTRRPTSVTMRVATCSTCGSSRNCDVGQLDLALALDVDLVRAVDHDVGDGVVLEQRLERPEAHHVVDQQPHDRAQLGRVQLDLQVDDDLLDDLGDLGAQLLRPERRGDRDVDALHQQRHHLRLDLQLALVLRLGRVLGRALGERVVQRVGIDSAPRPAAGAAAARSARIVSTIVAQQLALLGQARLDRGRRDQTRRAPRSPARRAAAGSPWRGPRPRAPGAADRPRPSAAPTADRCRR